MPHPLGQVELASAPSEVHLPLRPGLQAAFSATPYFEDRRSRYPHPQARPRHTFARRPSAEERLVQVRGRSPIPAATTSAPLPPRAFSLLSAHAPSGPSVVRVALATPGLRVVVVPLVPDRHAPVLAGVRTPRR